MQHKKGSESYQIPVEIAFAYRHSRANLIPRPYQAIPPADLPDSISTVTEAIWLYLDTFAESVPRKLLCKSQAHVFGEIR